MKETPTQKLKRELLEVRQQLFEVCNNPDSERSKGIIIQQKALMFYSKNKSSFYLQLKKLGFGNPPSEYRHYEL